MSYFSCLLRPTTTSIGVPSILHPTRALRTIQQTHLRTYRSSHLPFLSHPRPTLPRPRIPLKPQQTHPHIRSYRPPPPPPRQPPPPRHQRIIIYPPGSPPPTRYKTFPGHHPHTRGPLLVHAWRTKPGFRFFVYFIGGSFTIFYVANLEKVPVTGRWRFNCISAETEVEMADDMYEQTMMQYQGRIYGRLHPYTRKVRRVLDRLVEVSGLEGLDWEVHVIADPDQKNAFVIPGGKVFVFSGILPICSDDGKLAAVLAHEIAHNVAHHASERISKYFLVLSSLFLVGLLLGLDLGYGNAIGELVFLRPSSRKQESEADYIGLMMMAKACYDPEDAKILWERMKAAERVATPQFLSTHPNHDKRIVDIEKWMPEAEKIRSESDCASTLDYAEEFKKRFGYPRGPEHGEWGRAFGIRGL